MSLSTKGDFRIEFESNEQVKKFAEILENFQSRVQEHYVKHINPEFKGTVETSVQGVVQYDTEVEFEIYSGRERNFQWQVEYIAHFLKEVGGMIEFNSSVWVEGDSLCFGDQDELDEYEPNLK
jgi:hypothetical protein